MRLEKVPLFSERETIEEAFNYLDSCLSGMHPTDKVAALTGAMVLYNTVVNHVTLNTDKINENNS